MLKILWRTRTDNTVHSSEYTVGWMHCYTSSDPLIHIKLYKKIYSTLAHEVWLVTLSAVTPRWIQHKYALCTTCRLYTSQICLSQYLQTFTSHYSSVPNYLKYRAIAIHTRIYMYSFWELPIYSSCKRGNESSRLFQHARLPDSTWHALIGYSRSHDVSTRKWPYMGNTTRCCYQTSYTKERQTLTIYTYTLYSTV